MPYKRGKTWWISYYVDGIRKREAVGTEKREALQMEVQRKREVLNDIWEEPEVRNSKRVTVEAYAKAWLKRRVDSRVRTAKEEKARLRDYILPHLGKHRVADVKRTHIRAMMTAIQNAKSKATSAPLAPRTVLHIYGVARLMFADAVIDEVIPVSPCTLQLRKGELPKKRDADPGWRSASVYTRAEAEQLISDEIIPLERRVFYALMLLAGLRSGEAIGRKWSDYDTRAKPLGRLLVATQYDGQELKTQQPREVPVHPTLAKILADWKVQGFVAHHGRKPKAEDWIIPSNANIEWCKSKKTLDRLKDDLATLGLRSDGRGRHAMRATFISLARADGSNRDALARVTHDRTGDVFDQYTRWDWASLCEAVSGLKLELHEGQKIDFPNTLGHIFGHTQK